MSAQHEIRIAVVMYGGVSLCIYIHGVAQELLRLVRSTATPAPTGDAVVEIYRRISKEVRNAQGEVAPARFVIDLLSGTSAGGINAVFLAKALAVRAKNLDALRATWINVADMSKLLNNDADLFTQKRSLLRGQWMYEELYKAFQQIDKVEQCDEAAGYDQVKEIDLFVTTTDLNGVDTPIRLADRDVTERVHKGNFHFRLDGVELGDSGLSGVNDFTSRQNAILAFAARCTSSFPIAFEPMKLKFVERVIGKQEFAEKASEFRDYLKWVPQPEGKISFADRPLADGGYLDNKPFTYVISGMSYKVSDLPSTRKLLFVDPFPEMGGDHEPQEHFDFVANTKLAAMELPRYETIREDLERVQAANQALERLRALRGSVKGAVDRLQAERLEAQAAVEASEEPKEKTGFRKGLSALIEKHGPAYGTYHVIRVNNTTDDLARMFSAMAGSVDQENLFLAIQYLAAEWRKQKFTAEEQEGKLTESAFLSGYDYSFRLRLIIHLLEYANQNCSKEVRQRLIEQLVRIRRCRARFKQSGDKNPLQAELQKLLSWDQVRTILAGKTEEARISRAREIYARYEMALDGLATRVAEEWKPVFIANYRETQELFEVCPGLKEHYKTFDFQDMLSMTYLEGSEVRERAHVDVHRISPADGIQPKSGKKLAGYALGAFGAFLHEPWRENDILWGRLDAAEQLVRCLLPHDDQTMAREGYIRELRTAIVAQEVAMRSQNDPSRLGEVIAKGGVDVAATLENQYVVPGGPEKQQMVHQLGEASDILGRMIEEDLGRKGQPATLLKTFGGGMVGLVAFLAPGSLGRVFMEYWLALLATMGAILVLVGWIWEGSGVLRLGQIWLGVSVALWVLFQMAGMWMSESGIISSPVVRALRWIVLLVVVLLVGIGIWSFDDFLIYLRSRV